MSVRMTVTADRRPRVAAAPTGDVHLFVDGDRVVAGYEGEVPALEVAADDAEEAIRHARAALGGWAGSCLRVVREGLSRRSGSVEVTGAGALAQLVRAGVAELDATGPVAVVVETTGDPTRLHAALADVADLGAVVLAGAPLGREVIVDTYEHIHRRGLVVVGVAELDGAVDSAGDAVADGATLPAPETVSPSAVAAAGSAWYHVPPR